MGKVHSHSDEMIGVAIGGRYRLLSWLGAGGMGVAYRAWDEQDEMPVVLKIPKRVLLAEPTAAERFRREFRLLQGLNHPHIVPVVNVGEHEGLPFIVMRYLPGGSLRNRRLRDEEGNPRPNPPSMLHLWLPAVADALDHIHARGVVHRDVKPANIFFDAFWSAFLGDFGIAKVVEESDAFDKENTLTATHMGVGTHAYMAPETFVPKPLIDGRVDQYALAVVVYEMVAARRPFIGDVAHPVVEITTHPVPPFPATGHDIPLSLTEAVYRSLAKRPHERFASCRDFATAVLRDVPLMEEDQGITRLLCPNYPCDNLLVLKVDYAGKKGRCPKCHGRMKVGEDLKALWLLDEARRRVSRATDQATEDRSSGQGGQRDEEDVDDFQAIPVRSWADGAIPLWKQSKTWVGGHGGRLLGHACATMVADRFFQAACVSLVSHVALLLVMALTLKGITESRHPRYIIGGWGWDLAFEDAREEQLPDSTKPVVDPSSDVVTVPRDPSEHVQVIELTLADSMKSDERTSQREFAEDLISTANLLADWRFYGGATRPGGFDGRTDQKLRARLVQSSGGNAQSEAAVEAALKWIVSHQMTDGSWCFDHSKCPGCDGACSHPGRMLDRASATAMALLPFLGRGYTTREGPYKKQVEAGLKFLAELAVKGSGKAYEKDGNLYSQGLVGIALSEAYAMTQDSQLALPAQLVLNFIASAQDPTGGGWRYAPKQPGDTSAAGWQIMALKSGGMALLQVSSTTIKKAGVFLDSVQGDNGATYGYIGPGDTAGTSAVGLLCRINLGWKKDNPALQRGVDRLARMGPSNDPYFDYYATQVLHHLGDARWVAWNTNMRSKLVQSQEKVGHTAGSWLRGFDEGLGLEAGGRLYTTAMAAMILEVYYRHLAIYGPWSEEDRFVE